MPPVGKAMDVLRGVQGLGFPRELDVSLAGNASATPSKPITITTFLYTRKMLLQRAYWHFRNTQEVIRTQITWLSLVIPS